MPRSSSGHRMPTVWSSTVGSVKSTFVFIGPAIVAFVHRKWANFRKLQKLQTVQAHNIEYQKTSWHTSYYPSVSMCGSRSRPSIGISLRVMFNAGVKTFITLLSATFWCLLFIWIAIHDNVLYCTFVVPVSHVGTHTHKLERREDGYVFFVFVDTKF